MTVTRQDKQFDDNVIIVGEIEENKNEEWQQSLKKLNVSKQSSNSEVKTTNVEETIYLFISCLYIRQRDKTNNGEKNLLI